jgi:beta-phosphoglucomutase
MSKGCVIFDFDGVIADTESAHFAAYNAILRSHAELIGGAVQISRASYFTKYIVYGDREGFWHMLRDQGRQADETLVTRLAAAKHEWFQRQLADGGQGAEPLAGVREVLAWLEEWNVPRAICSGARREEIVPLLEAFKLRHHFDVLVTIEDVRLGKPDPQGYELAFDQLSLEYDVEVEKPFSLVIEDSVGGCAAGKAAGLRVLGVATSLPLDQVQQCATFAVESLAKLEKEKLAGWLGIGHRH